MKIKIVLILAVLSFIASYGFSQEDVLIDINGNLEIGTTNQDGRLEVFGEIDRFGIVGSGSGTGSGVYGENITANTYGYLGHYNYGVFGYSQNGYGIYGYTANGYAGYFQGNVLITGNLVIDGNLLGASIGDITAVYPGTGLTGGGTSGNVTLNVDFAGTGTTNKSARSDHNHNAVYSLVYHGHSGADITSGIVSESRIDQAVARDSEIMPTIRNNDGHGSGIDADKLDGMHYSDISDRYSALEARINALESAICQDAGNGYYGYNTQYFCAYYHGYYSYYGVNSMEPRANGAYNNIYAKITAWINDILID